MFQIRAKKNQDSLAFVNHMGFKALGMWIYKANKKMKSCWQGNTEKLTQDHETSGEETCLSTVTHFRRFFPVLPLSKGKCSLP